MSNWPTNGNLTGKLSVGQGERGRSLEYEWQDTKLGIRQEGEKEYQFVDLAAGVGAGREIELQVNNGYIQWKYKGETSWNDLISIDSLKGDKGERGEQGIQGVAGKDGKNGIDGTNGINGQDGVTPNITIGTVTTLEAGEQATVVNSGTKENPIFNFGIPKGVQGIIGDAGEPGEKGADGIDGKSLEFNWNGTELGIRQEGTSNYQYVNLEGKRGEQGIQGLPGKDGETPDMSDFENKINKQYETIKAKVDKIEQEDIPVEIPIVGSTLTLTTNKRQKVNMENNTTIVLPVVDKFTEIHLFFTTTKTLTLTLPKIKWQGDISIEANKTYEFVFTYINNSWLGGCVVYV